MTSSACGTVIPVRSRSSSSCHYTKGVYPKGVGRAISHISKSGGWSFGLHIFDRLLLVVALGIPVMSIVTRDYLKLVLGLYV